MIRFRAARRHRLGLVVLVVQLSVALDLVELKKQARGEGPPPPVADRPGAGSSSARGIPISIEPEPAGSSSLLGVVRESLFGEASSEDWEPLSWRDLLTDGWDEPFVFSPASDSGALRQEWINAANGVFYRQWVLDYIYRNNVGSQGDQHFGSWFIFAPLSRRFEILFTVPFVDARRSPAGIVNSTPGTGQGGLIGSPGGRGPGRFQSEFGDLSITPQVLLHETRNTSIMSIMTIRTPTGDPGGGNGHTAVGPQLQFWQGLPRRWVVRGGAGTTVPLTATDLRTTFDGNLTVGKFLTRDEVRYFKEFTVYLAANVSTTLDNRGPGTTNVTLLPGLRFRLAPDYWFLYGLEVAPGNSLQEDYAMFFRLVKRY